MADAPTPLVFQPRSEKERRDAARQYERTMAPVFAEQLQAARKWLVQRYRKNPGGWGSIDSAGDRWYRAEHWKDDGTWIGPDGWHEVKHPEGGTEIKPEIKPAAKSNPEIKARPATEIKAKSRRGGSRPGAGRKSKASVTAAVDTEPSSDKNPDISTQGADTHSD